MVDVRVSVELPGAARVYAPTLADHQTTAVAVSHTRIEGLVGVVAVAAGVVVLILLLVLVRARYAAHRRRDRPAPRHAR